MKRKTRMRFEWVARWKREYGEKSIRKHGPAWKSWWKYSAAS